MNARIVSAIAVVVALVAGGAWLISRDSADPVQAQAMAAVDSGEPIDITVYKTPTCGCCGGWADHLEESGFKVTRVDVADLSAVKDRHGVPYAMRTCHTAVARGKVIEGHVPAEEIRRFLAEERPEAGLAVPGMPMGSPGMEGPRSDPYAVYAFDGASEPTVFATRE